MNFSAPGKSNKEDRCVHNPNEKWNFCQQLFNLRLLIVTWWRHQMETFSALLAIYARSPVNSPHKDQWRGVLIFSLICVWINGWVNNREADDLRRHRAHYDVIVMDIANLLFKQNCKPVSWKKKHIYFKSNILDNKFYGAPCWPHELCSLEKRL